MLNLFIFYVCRLTWMTSLFSLPLPVFKLVANINFFFCGHDHPEHITVKASFFFFFYPTHLSVRVRTKISEVGLYVHSPDLIVYICIAHVSLYITFDVSRFRHAHCVDIHYDHDCVDVSLPCSLQGFESRHPNCHQRGSGSSKT